MKHYQFKLDFEVRDYECDLQRIVNNANYQHYLEHARHLFLKQKGIDFSSLAERGINLVIVRIEIDYLYPLRSGDQFFVGVNLERVSRLRFGFLQDIYRLPDNKSIAKAKVIVTSVNEDGRPNLPKEIEELLEN
ncbi:MAG: acyl-CoA thioesterase [Chloroflexi bacterium]|nr:acyl-CoA thioesterase [Chloroflexota bacterium]